MMTPRILVALMLTSMTAIALALSYPAPTAWAGPAIDAPSATSARQQPPDSGRTLPGPPTWPANPAPIRSAPAASNSSGGGDAVPALPLILAGAGGLAAVGVASSRVRVRLRSAR
jgi:hypothetical protein